MSDYKITPEQATNGTFSVKSHANVRFDGGVQQEVTDNSYSKAISNAASGISDWITKDPSTATVDMDAMNALTQTDVTPQQSENFVNKAGEILQPVMHRAEQIYLWNKADWAQSAYDSGEALGISPDLIMASGQDGIRRAEAAAAQINRGKTINEVYELYPELVGINYKNSAEAITTLQNLQSVKDTHGVWDSIQQNTWAINDQIKLGKVGMELSTATDPQRIQELNDEVERLQSNLSKYRKSDDNNVLENVVGATASQVYMMAAQAIMGSNRAAEGMALGAAAGAAATAPLGGEGAIPGALAGLSTGVQVGMAEQMYQMSFGNKYLELIQKRDANGNQVYSNEEARKYAMSYAAIDAGIEFVATKAIGKGINNIAPKSALAKVITNGTTDVAATFDRGIGTTVAQMAKNSIKAGVPELFEEGLQDVNEKVQHNLTRKDNDLEGYYSVGDIAIGSLDAMKQALPAVIGFGAIGGAVGGVRTAKAFRDFQKLTPEQQQAAIIAEQNRNGAVIMDNVRKDSTTNKIAKENPELYGKIVQAQGDKVGVSTQYVDVAELVQSENGQLAIRDMVDNGLVTQEEVKAAIEADAPVEIPIGSYAQVSMNLSDETVDALKQTSYFTRGGMSLATLERAKQEVDVAKSVLKDDTSKRAERIKDDIIRNEFDGASDIDREVLNEVLSDPTNIKRNFNNLLHTLKEQYRETYASDFDNADKSINDAVSTGIEPQWLTDYKANNGGKAPRTNAERRRAAYEYSRATTTANLDGNADALAQSDAHYADMEHMLMQIESLEAMKDKVFELANNDIALRMQLSKSGYDVYNEVVKTISESTNRKQRETAKANALLMAQHADIMAQYMRQMGKGGYTAMDYLRDSVRINMNAVLENQKGYAQQLAMHQKLQADITQWGKTLDDLQNGTLKRSVNKIMSAPLVFSTIKDPDYKFTTGDVYITTKMLNKVFTTKHAHKFDLNVMKQLPGALSNPIAIFKNFDPVANASVKGEIVAVVELKDTQNNFIHVPLVFDVQSGRGGYQTRVKSIFPRVNATWYSNAINNGDLLYVNTKKINRLTVNNVQSNGQVSVNRFNINNSIPNEKDLDKLRKKHNYQYYQSAWHGSPYDFDEFDLGSIGGGLGTQAFGWGLYFTENKNVAEKYKVERKSKNKFTLNGNDIPIEYAPVIEQIFGGINVGNNKESLLNRLVLNRDAEQSNLDLVTKNLNELDGVLDFITQNSKFAINKLPTLVDNKFERMATVILNDAKTKAKSDNKRVNKEYLFDVIEELQKRYHKHYIFYNDIVSKNSYLIDNIDNFEVTSVYKPTLYNVEIPDTDTMLDYSKPINEQSEYVLNKIKQLDPTDINKTGKEFYNDLSERLGGDKNASLKLNELGIKGIKYKHGLSHNFVVFDDKAIKVIEKYNQSVNGMTEIMSDGERIINIFKTADRSTFLHEMGHVFFDDIQKLASMDNAPSQLVTDWNKLKEWSGWVDGENVDNTKAHEKFARGWESYLRSGEAPTKGLQRVFRQFSKWLTRIYRSVQRLGGEVPSDIKDIMARMIATQDDIENYAHEQALEQFENTKLYQQLSETEQARVQGYIADIKEKAKERVMRKYMKELDNRPIKEWEDVKDNVEKEIGERLAEDYPIYKEHRRYIALGAGALENTQYRTIEGLEKAEREEAGSTYDEAVAQEMENARNEFVNDPNAGKSNQEIAEEMLLSNQGQMELTQEEARLIKAHTNKDLARNWELLSKLQKLDPNSENLDEELKPIEKELTKAERIKKDHARVAQELGNVSKELDTAQERIEKLKAQLQERIDAVRAIRDGGFGTIPKYMERAKRELGDITLSQASQYKKYQNQAVRDGKKSDSALAVGKVDEALYAKQSQMLNQARARVAFENSKAIKKLRTKLLDQLGRITRSQNPIMIEPNMRYFYTHMAYQMGLTKYDGLKPVDGFDMMSVIKALDADADIMGDNEATVELEDWVKAMFTAQSPRMFSTLKMSELEQLEELMTGMYKNGKTQYEGSTLIDEKGNNVTFDEAIFQIIDKAAETFGRDNGNVFNELNNRSRADALANTINNFHLSLLKAETFLRRLDGGKNGPAVRYIYDPIDKATRKFNEYQEKSMYRLARDVKAVYSKKQLFDVRNDHLYNVGELRNVTKEQIIMLALNWGTEKNRQRALETIQSNEVEMERAFQEYMTDKDWEFVIRTWEHINSFYEERSKVQEELYGNPLKKEKGITFTIGGREIQGQYFPIVYNPKVSAKVSDFETEDIAKTMIASNAIFGTGMGATKPRLDVVKGKSLMLDFDVIPNAITEAINHVTMRKAVTDVNKLVGNSRFQEYIVDKFGMETYQFLRTWVRDNWKDEAAKLNAWDRLIMTMKKNTTTAVMSGRVPVALQNALNIPVAMYRIGVGNTLKAISDAGMGFYGVGTNRYNATRDFVLSQSIFMRERVQTLDKDLKQGLSIEGKGLRISNTNIGGYKVEQLSNIRDDINQMGFRLLTETDFALSIPVWKFAYDQKILELQSKEGVTAEFVEQEAISAGDRAVRDIFGSGDTKDSATIQRSRHPIAQLFTPFYSYANTLYNILAEGSYKLKDQKEYGQFVRMLWWTIVVPALGMMAYKAMTNGDDDNPEDLAKSFAEELASQSIMGVPIVRDIANITMRNILGEKSFGKTNSVIATSIVDKVQDVYTAIHSKKKDATDVGRSLSQVSNRIIGFSDTITDGLWTLSKFALTDTDAKLEDVIMSIILDKKLKDKKSKKKDKH